MLIVSSDASSTSLYREGPTTLLGVSWRMGFDRFLRYLFQDSRSDKLPVFLPDHRDSVSRFMRFLADLG